MINTAPLRRTTLHFSHIGFTDARTFITDPCHSSRRIVGSSLPYIPGPNHSTAATGPRRTREIRRVLLRLPGPSGPGSGCGMIWTGNIWKAGSNDPAGGVTGISYESTSVGKTDV